MIRELQDAYVSSVERALESTVSVSSTAHPFRQYGGPFGYQGLGSGVVMDDEGHILTNYHVARGEKSIVTLADGRVFGGEVVGGDEETDVAVIRVEGDGLKPAEFGDSDSLKVGQPVLAIGNPLGLSGGPTVTSGVVSSLRRSLRLGNGNGVKVVQTDAPVNPGNSGGPIVDLEGRVVAITTAMIPYAKGIGFGIPVNVALKIAREILEHGGVQRAWLGIVGHDVDRRVADRYGLKTTRGVFVVEVSPESPARSAGVLVGDVVLSVDGGSVESVSDLVESLREKQVGKKIELEVERHGERRQVSATLAARPF